MASILEMFWGEVRKDMHYTVRGRQYSRTYKYAAIVWAVDGEHAEALLRAEGCRPRPSFEQRDTVASPYGHRVVKFENVDGVPSVERFRLSPYDTTAGAILGAGSKLKHSRRAG